MPQASVKLPRYGVALACLALLNWSLTAFIGRLPEGAHWLILIPTALFGVLLDRYPRYLGLALLALVLSVPLWFRFYPVLPEWTLEALFSSWALLRDGWLRQVKTIDPTAAWTLSVLGGTLFSWSLHRYAIRLPRPWIPVSAGILFLAAQWIMGFSPATTHLAWFLLAGFTLLALSRAQDPGPSGFEVSRPQGSGIQLGLGAVAVLALLVTTSHLLSPMAPAWHWGQLGRWVVQRVPALTQWESSHGPWGGPVDLLSGTWGSSSTLGGPLALTGRPLLSLHFEEVPQWPVYLREAALVTYTGRGWAPPSSGEERREYQAEQRLPTLTVRGAPIRYTLTNLEHDIWYLPLAYDAERLSLPVRVDGDKNIIAEQPLRAGQEVGAITRQPRVSSETLLAGESTYNEALFASYLRLPTLPAEVEDLVDQLVGNTPHPYEQALIIEDYLRQHYPYRLDMPLPPPDMDFVAHFLFEVQEGYCSYHATAMAVMLRIAGIPSRWVQGFRLGESTSGEDNREVFVDSDRAHAWVEAYFSGHGWVIFEPTPGLAVPDRDSPVTPIISNDGWWGDEDWELPPHGDDLPWEDDWAEGDVHWQHPDPVEGVPSTPYLGALTALALGGLAFTLWGLNRDLWMTRRGLSPTYARGLILLKWAGLPMKTGETPGEYAQRVRESFPALERVWQQLTQDYALLAYGTSTTDPPGMQPWSSLLRRLRVELGPWRYARTRLFMAWDIKSYWPPRHRES